jgi:CheY-like chemotaxis protein
MTTNKLAAPIDIPKARILVVDDNPGTARMLARAIAHISPNLEVVSATDGRNALEQVKGKTVHLIITDMMMPEMNGLELIENLRLQSGGEPLYSILITAYDIPELQESTRRVNVNETLIKPIHPERICRIVSRAIEKLRLPVPPQTWNSEKAVENTNQDHV